MSRTMTADAIEHDRARRRPCPDCDDKTYIWMLGEEYPFPACCPKMFEEDCRERRIGAGQFGAGR